MFVSYEWISEYFDQPLPDPGEFADKLTLHAYEVEELKKRADHTVFDIDVLPNRAGDSLSHIGIAREIGTLLNVSPQLPSAKTSGKSLSSNDYVNLSVESEYVRRATKRIVAEVEVGESSNEIKQRLKALGQKPINNVVDLTNYVMLETGQPVHAFDYDKIAGDAPKEIVIREAQEGETITTLDGNDYELEEGMLVIADKEKPLDIAGIKGGLNSHIDQDTTRVLLSVCSFDPTKIRTTSQKLNLRTDASKRFENNISTKTVKPAMERLSYLIENHAGGTVGEDIQEVYLKKAGRYVTGMRPSRANELLGTDLSSSEAKDILERVYCEVKAVNPAEEVVSAAGKYEGVPYKLGASISFEAPDVFDCSSFISFLFSHYGGVSIPRMSVDQYVYGTHVSEDEMQAGDVIYSNTGEGEVHTKTKEFMPGTKVPEGVDHCGLYLGGGKIIHASGAADEVVTESLENSKQFQNVVGIRRMADDKRLRVEVPYWRQDLRREEDLIEEVGRVYGYESISAEVSNPVSENPSINKQFYYENKIRDLLVAEGFSEVYTHAFDQEGVIELKNPSDVNRKYMRTSLEEGLSAVLEKNKKHEALLEGDDIRVFEVGKVFEKEEEVLVLGLAADNTDTVDSGINAVCSELGINPDNFTRSNDGKLAEVNLSELAEELPDPDSYEDLKEVSADVTYQPFSKYPYVLRDIAVWTPAETRKEDVREIINSAANKWLVTSNHFDTYEKDSRISYAFQLVFQSDEKTLSDEEVNKVMKKIEKEFAQKDGFSVR